MTGTNKGKPNREYTPNRTNLYAGLRKFDVRVKIPHPTADEVAYSILTQCLACGGKSGVDTILTIVQ